MADIWATYNSYTHSVGPNGSYESQPDGTGLNVSFEAGVNLANSPYSIGLGFRNSSDGAEYSYFGYDTEEASYTTLDFEIGRDLNLGAGNSRITLGVRGAAVNVSGTYSYHSHSDGSSSFIGAGPRVALENSFPITDRVSVDVEAGAAVLFGTTSNESDYSGFHHHGPGADSNSSTETVTNMDFSAALSYLVGSDTKVSLGYRMESFSGLEMYNYNTGPTDEISDQGAFLKFTTGF